MIVARTADRPRTMNDLIGPALSARLDRLDLLSQRVFSGKLPGERRSKRRGRSVEFDDYRDYAPGDDLRHVDWNVLARLDRFFVKLFREDQDLSLQIFLDASPSMDAGEPNKLVFSARLAMALAYIGLANQDRVSLSIYSGPGAGVRSLAPLRARSNARRVAEALLAAIEGSGTAGPPGSQVAPARDFSGALRLLGQARRGTGVTVVISDFLVREGWKSGLNALFGAGGFDTWCVQVLSPGEIDPATERAKGFFGDLRLTDVESGAGSEITVSGGSIRRYRAALGKLRESLAADCRARGMHCALISSQESVEDVVLGSLRRGGLLR